MSELASLETLSAFLDQLGMQNQLWKPQQDQEQGYIETGWLKGSVADDGFTLFVDPYFEQNFLYLTTPRVAFIPQSVGPEMQLKALTYISAQNYQLPGGAFGYDPSDGEVAFRLSVALSDNNISFETFERLINLHRNAVGEMAEALTGLLTRIPVKVAETESPAKPAPGPVSADATPEELHQMFMQFLNERNKKQE